MPDRLVTWSVEDDVALITLDDPGRRNALSKAMSDELAAGVAGALAAGARALVLTAAPPVFCAGGSLDDLVDPAGPLSGSYAGLHALLACPVPTIAAVDGAAIGAGVSLPVACDVAIASERARFDPRFLDAAIHPGGGHLRLMARRVGYQGAAAMTICGDVLTGAEAFAAGLVWRCVAGDEVLPVAFSLARKAASRPAALVARTKETLAATAFFTDQEAAERIELAAQEWSVAQPEHRVAVRRLRDRIQGDR